MPPGTLARWQQDARSNDRVRVTAVSPLPTRARTKGDEAALLLGDYFPRSESAVQRKESAVGEDLERVIKRVIPPQSGICQATRIRNLPDHRRCGEEPRVEGLSLTSYVQTPFSIQVFLAAAVYRLPATSLSERINVRNANPCSVQMCYALAVPQSRCL